MTTPTIQDISHPTSGRSERMQDLLLVSSFGLWAVVLGLVPALAFRMVIG
jgi:hypothetical protein